MKSRIIASLAIILLFQIATTRLVVKKIDWNAIRFKMNNEPTDSTKVVDLFKDWHLPIGSRWV